MRHQNFFPKGIIVILLIPVIYILSSCNNAGKDKTTGTDTTVTADTTGGTGKVVDTAGAFTVGSFKQLVFDSLEIDKFFNPTTGPKCSKIVFRFNYDGSTSIVTVDAFGFKKNDKKYIQTPVSPIAKNGGVSLGATLYLSDLELKKNEYGSIPGEGKYLILDPILSSTHTNYVTYRVFYRAATTFIPKDSIQISTGQELNPSPPADPGN